MCLVVLPLELSLLYSSALIFNETFIKKIIENLIEQQYHNLIEQQYQKHCHEKRGEEGTFEA